MSETIKFVEFVDDASLLYLRSRLTGPFFSRLLQVLEKHTSYRRMPFKLRAKPLDGGGTLVELTLTSSGSEVGDEKLLGPLCKDLDCVVFSSGITFIVSMRFKD